MESDRDELEVAKLASEFAAWYGVSTFFRCPYREDPSDTEIAIVGAPSTAGNMIERGQYLAPRLIRNASGGLRRAHRELAVDTFGICRISDLGDAPVHNMVDPTQALQDMQAAFEGIDAAGAMPMAIGGDHGVTLPILRALAGPTSRTREPVALVLFDSHTDAYDPISGIEHAGSWAKSGVAEGLIDADRSLMIGLNGGLPLLGMETWARDPIGRSTSTNSIGSGLAVWSPKSASGPVTAASTCRSTSTQSSSAKRPPSRIPSSEESALMTCRG